VARNAGSFLYAPTLSLPEGSKIPKGRGECSMVGKGARQRNHLARSRQHKVCMAKARLPESQSSRCNGPRHRRVVEAMYWVIMGNRRRFTMKRHDARRNALCTSLPSVPPIGGLKGRTGRLNTPHLCHTVIAGSPTQVMELEAHTCMVTEPPYYSRWACNGFRSQSERLDRQGYKRMVTTRKSPTVWEEGRQPLFVRAENQGELTLPG
jgi:hypothetical protein